MTDLDRVLDSLVHDLRSPLGVASGYVRLLKEGRVAGPDEADRVLGKVQDALRAISTLCEDASAWLEPDPVNRLCRVTAARLAALVAERVSQDAIAIDQELLGDEAIALRADADGVSAAVTTVLTQVPHARDARVSIHLNDTVLRFDLVEPTGHPARPPFDPWEHTGLSVPLACRAIRRAGGDWMAPGHDGAAVSIAFRTAEAVASEHG